MSHPILASEVEIPVNFGPAVLDRALLVGQLIEFTYDGQGPRAFCVIQVARNCGITQLLLENSRYERNWYNLSAMKDIYLL